MTLSLLGIDLAKNVFHFWGVDAHGRRVYQKKAWRSDVLVVAANLPKCRVVMEACGGANYWAREFEKLGHKVELIAPQYVKPFVQRNKNDWKDAEAITVAARQPHMRYVPKRDEGQQDIHRVRERLVKARTALVNEIRGLLTEYGVLLPQGRRKFEGTFLEVFSQHEAHLSRLAVETFYDLWSEYHQLNKKVLTYEKILRTYCKEHPVCARLVTVPGVGPLTATAIVAKASDVSVFKNGREYAAWLGLTPKESSTGGKQTILGVSKRGDKYIRTLLCHGARTVLQHLKEKDDAVSCWARNLKQQKGMNKTTVALANKNARVIWNLLAKEQEYQTFPLAA